MGKARRTMKQNNKEKEATKTRQRKKQKTKHDDTEEYSNSSTNLNSLSQSWECPVSARKHPIVDPMRIGSSSRRATLRSSKTKNLIETGIINFSRCSRPQKSKEHFASTHATRQLDDLANQVPQSSRVESASRYPKQVEPSLRQKEIEKGGNGVDEENVLRDVISDLNHMLEEEVGEKEVPLADKPILVGSPSFSRKKQTVNMAIDEHDEVQAHQVSQGSNRESPSRYLKQMEPNLKYREIEKGGKCVVVENDDENFLRDLIAKMTEGKVGEKEVHLAEKPISMLESQECSISTRQMEIVSSRIASLRSLNTERPIETVMTDLLKSRKHSSATNAIQQLNDLAYQVPQSSQLESPSRYLKQGEPSVRHEEIEKGGNFAAKVNLGDGIAVLLSEMMEEVGEKEMPLVEKPMSVVRSPAFSIKLTEFVNMAVDQDDEVDSQRCAMDTVLGYRVKPEFMAILKKILDRRGDIAKNCTVSIMELRSGLLEMICGIISHLQGKDLKQIKEDFLHHNIALVDGMKNMELDIEWLRVLLNDLLEAKQQLGGKFGKLREKKDINKKSIEDAERDLAECQERKRKLSAQFKEVKTLLDSTLDEEIVRKETLAKAKDESTKISQTIKCATSNVMRFLNRFSVDDLL